MSDDSQDFHVLPDFGRPHELSWQCWCVPSQDQSIRLWFSRNGEAMEMTRPAGPVLWIHNLAN